MTRFIPREKLGRKARKELDARQRHTWPFPPVMKKIESRKKYNRKKNPMKTQSSSWDFHFSGF